VIKNAIAYITRKRNRTLIIFIIITIVLSCLYSCLTIMKSSNEIEKALYESSNSSISITKKDGKYFNVNQFKDIEKLKEIEEKIIQYDGLAKLKDAKVVSGEQRINREDLSDEFKNVVSLEATNNTKRNILFSSGVFTIKEGKNIEENDKNSIIVHEEFAKQNNLKLGDEVDLELLDIEKSGKIKSHKFKIIGSFSGKKQETYTGLSSDFSENMVFVDYSTSQEILNKSENNKIANKILMYSGSAESTDLALNKLKELKIDESKYFVEKDSKAFEESLESVSGIKHIIKIMTYSIMLGGMVVLSLILILWLRERIYEIGIFLSIGTSKIQIIMQFIFELIFISIPSIISSLFLGNVLLKVIVDGFINSEDSMISGGSLINNSSFMLNITTLGQSYLILISIIVLSVVFASSLILIKKPKEILSKKNVAYSYANSKEKVLSGVNQKFELGKFYAIVGKSGTGKSTLLSLLAGLDKPQTGKILFKNEDIQKKGYSNHRKNNISLVFQNYNLIDYLSPIENIRLVNKSADESILFELGLDKKQIKRNVMKLSGGQQQRVAIARALVSDAPIILADEPTGNLDSVTAGEIINILKTLAKERNKCVIVVTHSKEAADSADIILELSGKKLKKVK